LATVLFRKGMALALVYCGWYASVAVGQAGRRLRLDPAAYAIEETTLRGHDL
jgi:hypothetical protein